MRRRPSRMALLILCGTLAAHAGDKAEPAVGAAALAPRPAAAPTDSQLPAEH